MCAESLSAATGLAVEAKSPGESLRAATLRFLPTPDRDRTPRMRPSCPLALCADELMWIE